MLNSRAEEDKLEFENWLRSQGVYQTYSDAKDGQRYLCFKDLSQAEAFENSYFKLPSQPSKIIEFHDRMRTGFHKVPISSENKETLKKAYNSASKKTSGITIYSASLTTADNGCKVALRFNDIGKFEAFLDGWANVMGMDALKVLDTNTKRHIIYIRNMEGFDCGSTEHDGELAINCDSRYAATSIRDMLSLTEEHVTLIEGTIVFKGSILPLKADRKTNISTTFKEPVDNRCVKMLKSCESSRLEGFISEQITKCMGVKLNRFSKTLLWTHCTLINESEDRHGAGPEPYIALSNTLRECLESRFVSFIESAEKALAASTSK